MLLEDCIKNDLGGLSMNNVLKRFIIDDFGYEALERCRTVSNLINESVIVNTLNGKVLVFLNPDNEKEVIQVYQHYKEPFLMVYNGCFWEMQSNFKFSQKLMQVLERFHGEDNEV